MSEYWDNRVVHFFREIWPKDGRHLTPEVTEQMAEICIEAGENFAKAFMLLGPWLAPVKYSDMLISRMSVEGNPWDIKRLSEHFPNELLQFLKLIIGDTPIISSSTRPIISQALEIIKENSPHFTETPIFQALAAKFSRS